MRAMLSHSSALRFWRNHFPADGELGDPCTINGAEAYAFAKRDVENCIPEAFWLEGEPLDILALDAHQRSKSRSVKYHVWSSDIPEGSFYRSGNMLVSSPEFVFLQMAGTLTVVQLAALGCELCGLFILQPRSERLLAIPNDAPTRRFPLTSAEKLRQYLDLSAGARHLGKAKRALRYVVDNSRSPMECVTALQLYLPPKLGGYGIPKPTMNPIIHLDDIARKIAGKRWCEGDACWIEHKLDLEYNGAVHAGTAQMRSDTGRIIALQHMGWTVIAVTSAQVLDIEQFEAVVDQIAKPLKHRIRSNTRGATLARLRLHEDLSDWLDINS